jgi:hypothetical protein
MQAEEITRNPEEMLINALQGRDELNELRPRLFHGAATLHRMKPHLIWPASAPSDLRQIAQQIWESVSREGVMLSSLFQLCSCSELKIYRVVDELVTSQQLDLSPVEAGQKVA